MGVLANVPFLGGYNEQDQINRAQESQGFQRLGQMMQMQHQDRTMRLQDLEYQKKEQQAKALETWAASQSDPQIQAMVRAAGPAALPYIMEKMKPQGLISAGPGITLFDPKTREAVFSNPKEAPMTPLAKLYAERQALQPGDPRIQAYDNAIRKESETAKQISPTIVMPKQDKVPMGYRLTPDGNLEAIKGGPADAKIQGANNSDTAALEASTAALNRLGQQVKLVKDSNLGRITGLTGALPNVPGSAGSDAQGRLEALKSQVGFSVLQTMKDAAKTGSSGLGQVTEKEHTYLQAQLGNLAKAQSETEIRRVLNDIETFAEDAKGRIRNAYNMKHSDGSQGGSTSPNVVTSPDGQQISFPSPAAANAFKKSKGW